MAAKGARVHIYGDWDGAGVKRATKDLTQFEKVTKRLKVGLGVAAAAAGAFALKLGVDAARAAIAEEQELVKLNMALENLGFAGASAEVSAFIDNLQYSVNVSDGELRPAYARLLRSTKSVEESQRALALATDISAATGKDMDTVANALGKAYDGNTASLGRLGLGLDKAYLKTANMQEITDRLRDSFGGQASAQSRTLGGAIKGVGIAWDELTESFGAGLIGNSSDDIQQLEEIEARLRSAQPAAERAGEDVRNLGIAALTTWDRISAMNGVLEKQDWGAFWQMMSAGATGNDREFGVIISQLNSTAEQLSYVQYEAYKVETAWGRYTTAAQSSTRANDDQVASIKRLQTALSNLSGERSILQQKFDLANLLKGGPGESGKRKGDNGKVTSFTTLGDRKAFAFDVANQYGSLASDLLADRKRGQARNALADARAAIRGMNLPGAFEQNLLSTLRTPSALRPTDRARPGTPETGAQVGGVNYNIGTINVNAETPTEALEKAKRYARLRAMNGRNVNPNLRGMS
jgi:hypothetical protein